jgi:hypothetical protein
LARKAKRKTGGETLYLREAAIAALGIGFVFAACAAIHYQEALRPALERWAHYWSSLSSVRAA